VVAGAVIVAAQPQARLVPGLPAPLEQAPQERVRRVQALQDAVPRVPQVQVSRQLRGAAEAVVAGALSHPRQY